MSQETYVCSKCKRELAYDGPKEEAEVEALVEAKDLFGEHAVDLQLVCDDCFKFMTAGLPPAEWVKRQNEEALIQGAEESETT